MQFADERNKIVQIVLQNIDNYSFSIDVVDVSSMKEIIKRTAKKSLVETFKLKEKDIFLR